MIVTPNDFRKPDLRAWFMTIVTSGKVAENLAVKSTPLRKCVIIGMPSPMPVLVLIAAATDRRVRCVVSQVPYIHGLETSRLTNTPDEIQERMNLIDAERESLSAGNPPNRISVCEHDATRAENSPGNRTYEFFHAFDNSSDFRWPNEFTVRSLELRLEYDALSFARLVSPTPLLMIVADDDEITPTDLAIRAYDYAAEPKNLHVISGDHYRPYLEAFDESSGVACEWFVRHLLET